MDDRRKVAIRIALDGGAEVRADLDKTTRTGEEGFKRWKDSAAGVERQVDGVRNVTVNAASVLNIVRAAALSAGAAFSSVEILRVIRETASWATELGNSAKAAGLSAEAFQAYQVSALAMGDSSGAATEAIRRFTRALGEADAGAGPARQALRQLQLSASELAGGPQAALPKVAAALLAIQDVTKRARLEAQLFGDSGQKIDAQLKNWTEPADALIARMRAVGLVIDQSTIDKAAKFQAAWTLAGTAIEAFFAKSFFPSLEDKWRQLDALANAGARGPSAPAAAKTYRERADAIAQQMIDAHNATLPFLAPESFQPNAKEWTGEYDKLIGQMRLARDLAGETAQARELDEKLIAAANVVLKDQGETGEKILTSMRQVRDVLGEQRIQQIALLKTQTDYNAGLALGRNRIAEIRSSSRPVTPIDSLTKQADEKTGRDVAASINALAGEQRRKLDVDYNQEAYLSGLQEEVRLAGLLPDARAREIELLRVKERFGDVFAQQHEQEILALIRQGQEAERYSDLQARMVSSFGQWLDTVATNGKASFKDLFASILNDWRRTLTQMLAEQALQSLFGKSGGGFNILSAIFSGISGAVSGGIAGGGAEGAGLSSANAFFDVAHSGGRPGIDPLPTRSFPIEILASAPRYHSGSTVGSVQNRASVLAADEIPAILQTGERVLNRQEAGEYAAWQDGRTRARPWLGAGLVPAQAGNSVNITVKVDGAAGDAAIERGVEKAVRRAVAASGDMLRSYDKQLDGRVVPVLRRASNDPRWLG